MNKDEKKQALFDYFLKSTNKPWYEFNNVSDALKKEHEEAKKKELALWEMMLQEEKNNE